MPIITILLGAAFTAQASVDAQRVPIADISIDEQLSRPESPVLEAKLLLPNGCFDPLLQREIAQPENNVVTLESLAKIENRACTMAVIPTDVYFDLTGLQPGTYKIVDRYDRSKIGSLYVDETGNHKIIQ